MTTTEQMTSTNIRYESLSNSDEDMEIDGQTENHTTNNSAKTITPLIGDKLENLTETRNDQILPEAKANNSPRKRKNAPTNTGVSFDSKTKNTRTERISNLII